MRRVHQMILSGFMVINLAVGCAQSNSTIRAQSPSGPIIGSAPAYGELSTHYKKEFTPFSRIQNHNFGYEGGYYTHPAAEQRVTAYPPSPDYGQACQPGHQGCPRPVTTHTFNAPRNLAYPAPVTPSGFVNYPYYTHRGPTDFFMK